jgi:hypothetical protein
MSSDYDFFVQNMAIVHVAIPDHICLKAVISGNQLVTVPFS